MLDDSHPRTHNAAFKENRETKNKGVWYVPAFNPFLMFRVRFCSTSQLGLADEDYLSCRSSGLSVTSDSDAHTLRQLFTRQTFRVTVVRNASATVELCGALKNVVALGAAFCDGLGYGGNTKAAIVRTGLMEMRIFAERLRSEATFDATASSRAFLESCGIGDLMTTCYGNSRNRKCAEMFARESGKRSWEQLEEEELGGMKLQGPSTAVEAFGVIKKRKSVRRFPLLTTIYRIAHEGQDAKTIVEFDKGGASSGPTDGGRRRTDTSTDFLSSRL